MTFLPGKDPRYGCQGCASFFCVPLPVNTKLEISMYQKFWKRALDLILSFTALLLLAPLLLLLTILGVIIMRGNPFFTQRRPGLREKPFLLIKFRSMSDLRDRNGDLLPDVKRLTGYGKFLRAASLDELPELFNILKGDMSLVGPRPLLMEYLEYYNESQRHRHDVRPGLTGLAQVHGRNASTWEERFEWDLRYVSNVSLKLDLSILLKTVVAVFRHEGIHAENSATMEKFKGSNTSL